MNTTSDPALGQLVPRSTECRVGQNAPPHSTFAAPPMQSSTLFTHLVLHLRHYADAAVLWAVLNEHADVQEYRTTSTAMASVVLGETIDRKTVQRSFKRLEDLGLVNVRVQSKTATRIRVNRQAVLELLRVPLRSDLPGLDTNGDFPFLHAWAEDSKAPHLDVA